MKVMGIFISYLVEEQNWHNLFVFKFLCSKKYLPICRIFDEKILYVVYFLHEDYN